MFRYGQPGSDRAALEAKRLELRERARIVLKIEQRRVLADERDLNSVHLGLGERCPTHLEMCVDPLDDRNPVGRREAIVLNSRATGQRAERWSVAEDRTDAPNKRAVPARSEFVP